LSFQALLPREGEKVAAKPSDEGAFRRLAARPDFILNLAPSSVPAGHLLPLSGEKEKQERETP
jgi:hypothetical protein